MGEEVNGIEVFLQRGGGGGVGSKFVKGYFVENLAVYSKYRRCDGETGGVMRSPQYPLNQYKNWM